MITTVNSTEARQDFLEIALYRTTRWYVYAPIMMGLLTGLVITADVAFYLIMGLSPTMVAISLLTLCLLLGIVYRYRHYLFPASLGTLIIAYGELYLIVQKQIQWSVSLKYCEVQIIQAADTHLLTLRLFDQQQLPIRIQYLRQMSLRKPPVDVERTAYGIFSATDWQKLLLALEHKYTSLS
ncbi:MAG: hypothetical protein AAF828_04380 [Bacteroidota bacterium]